MHSMGHGSYSSLGPQMHAKANNGPWKLEQEAFDFGIKLSIFMIHVKPGSGLQFLKSVWGELFGKEEGFPRPLWKFPEPTNDSTVTSIYQIGCNLRADRCWQGVEKVEPSEAGWARGGWMAVDTQSDPSLAHRQNTQFIHGSVEVPKCWGRRKMRGLGWFPLFNLNY